MSRLNSSLISASPAQLMKPLLRRIIHAVSRPDASRQVTQQGRLRGGRVTTAADMLRLASCSPTSSQHIGKTANSGHHCTRQRWSGPTARYPSVTSLITNMGAALPGRALFARMDARRFTYSKSLSHAIASPSRRPRPAFAVLVAAFANTLIANVRAERARANSPRRALSEPARSPTACCLVCLTKSA